ncbi:MAG: hypothetical protein P8Y12_00865 [Gammaproteobacteria bacterium]|jgi:hypothetical protein
MLRLGLVLIAVVLMSGCVENALKPSPIEPCTTEWFEYVEETLSTGDAQGHGPDIGSLEWRSVVEFKLGVRGDPSVPSADSKEWCNYINERILEYGT